MKGRAPGLIAVGALLVFQACSSDDETAASIASGGSAGAGGSAASGAVAGGGGSAAGAATGGVAGSASGGAAGLGAADAGNDGSAFDATTSAALVVATANTRCLLDDYSKRKQPLAGGIAALDFDLLALQEICKSSSTDSLAEIVTMISAQTGRPYTVVRKDTHYNLLAFADEGIAVVTPHPVVWQKLVDLPKGVFDRGAVMTRVNTSVGTVLFVATHLSFEPQADVRKAQLSKIRAEIQLERLGTEPVLLAGDMNEKPSGAAIAETITAGYVDLWATLKPGDPGHTSPVPNPTDRIDYVFAFDDAGSLTPSTASLFLDTPVGGTWPSDHFGVTTSLVSATKGASP